MENKELTSNAAQNPAIPSIESQATSTLSAAPAFTPGTWEAPYTWDASGLVPNIVTCIARPGERWKRDTPVICTLPPDPLNRANARLIAAAPALYAALKELLDCETNMAGCSGIKLLDAVDRARAALSSFN